MLERGVRFVEVQQDGWDTHADNFRATARLCSELDQSWSALIDDLDSRGLLEETVIVWLGEFGRTPRINAQNGRDHFPQTTPVVLGGGGISAGEVVGQTNNSGTQILGEPATVPDLFATIFTAMGIDPARSFQTAFGSPARATDDGVPIRGLLA